MQITSNQSSEESICKYLGEAYQEALIGYNEGGIPIGSVLVYKDEIIGRGHNKRIQELSPILHGEMDALENAGRLPADVYRNSEIYTTLSPCSMCAGAILLYRIPRVIIGENESFKGEVNLLKENGVKVIVLNDFRCKEIMQKFIQENPHIWNEDIGEGVSI